jgi:hypothetical protein
MGFDTIDAFPEPADLSLFFPEPAPALAPPPPMTDAERKRQERQDRKRAGLPDVRTVDVAIIAALVAALEDADVAGQMRAQGSVRGLTLDLEPLLREALRGVRRARVNDVPVTKQAAVEALQQRLRLR